jgi:hypothetical protein
MHGPTTTRSRWQAFWWSILVACSLLLASLLDAVVTHGSGGLALAGSESDHLAPRDVSNDPGGTCSPSPAQPLYLGLNTWVASPHWTCLTLNG